MADPASPPIPVLIPVNRLDRAKGRLADFLDAGERAELALATLKTVLTAVLDAHLRPVVLTADPSVAGAVGATGEVLLEDPALSGLNAQLERAVTVLGGDELMILHADLPLAAGAAITAVVAAAAAGPSVTIVRSGDGGTNLMLLRPPGRFPLAYGPHSAAAHRAGAARAHMAFREVSDHTLALDLDTPDDIRTLLGLKEGRTSRAGLLLLAIHAPARLAAPR
ncbi:MAG: 2-phospho-L-lactate guanylyltransferase [Chloroflexi bacterium]|nr:2-phospho-L-lactate guanylyltransferase [Chloroflexota bacterium]